METRNQEERDLVDSLRAQGKSDAEIQLQLDLRRAKRGSSIYRRNVGLPQALKTYPRNARSAAIGKNPNLKATIKDGKVRVDEIEAHHLIPIDSVRAFPELFEGAAREGWGPDEAGNVTAQPNSDPAQKRIYDATKQKLGTHFHGHPEWNEMVREKLDLIWKDIIKEYPSRSGADFDRECKRRVELLQDELSRIVPTGHISMRETTWRFA